MKQVSNCPDDNIIAKVLIKTRDKTSIVIQNKRDKINQLLLLAQT